MSIEIHVQCVVVMDKKQYVRETSKLLEDTKTYRPLDSDPTKKLKGRLQSKLRAFVIGRPIRLSFLQQDVPYI